jgi:hypothetical protein
VRADGQESPGGREMAEGSGVELVFLTCIDLLSSAFLGLPA